MSGLFVLIGRREGESLQSFAWLVGFLFAGSIIENVFHVPLPGNVIGMLLLFVALQLKWLKVKQVQGAADLLLSHMMLFFAPIVVGTIAYTELMKDNLWLMAAAIVGTTLAVLVGSGLSTMLLEKKSRREKNVHG